MDLIPLRIAGRWRVRVRPEWTNLCAAYGGGDIATLLDHVDRELARFGAVRDWDWGGPTPEDGYILLFPDQDSLVAFMMRWG